MKEIVQKRRKKARSFLTCGSGPFEGAFFVIFSVSEKNIIFQGPRRGWHAGSEAEQKDLG